MILYYAIISTWTGETFDFPDIQVRFYKTRMEAEEAEHASYFSMMCGAHEEDERRRVPEVFEFDTEDPNAYSTLEKDNQIRLEELQAFERYHESES